MPASAAPVRSRATLFSRKVIYGEVAVWIDTLSRGPPRSSPCSPPLHPQIRGSGSISTPPQPLGREHRTANRRGALQASGAAASKATDSGLKTVETDSLSVLEARSPKSGRGDGPACLFPAWVAPGDPRVLWHLQQAGLCLRPHSSPPCLSSLRPGFLSLQGHRSLHQGPSLIQYDLVFTQSHRQEPVSK